MPNPQPPPGSKPVVSNGVGPEAVEFVTGPIVVPQRVTIPRAPGVPQPPAPGEPTTPGGEPTAPLPVDVSPLLQLVVAELRTLNRMTEGMQTDMRALRQVLAGPFRFLTFAPQSVNITVPLSIAAAGRETLLVPQNFPGAVLFITVMTDDRNFRIRPVFDGTANPIDVDQLVTFNISQPLAPTGVNVQADPANSRFTTVLNPGGPEGLTFFRSFALEVENLDSAAHNVLDFLIVMRQYVPLELFPELVQLEV